MFRFHTTALPFQEPRRAVSALIRLTIVMMIGKATLEVNANAGAANFGIRDRSVLHYSSNDAEGIKCSLVIT
jgi:hypothetical protein